MRTMNQPALRKTALQLLVLGVALWLGFFALQVSFYGWMPNQWPSFALAALSSVANTLSLCSAVLIAIAIALLIFARNLPRDEAERTPLL